jgi:CBS domain-containing protein
MLAGIRNTFAKEELNDYLVTLDLTEPIAVKMTPEVRLSQALAEMERHGIDCIPVIASQQDDKYVSVLENSAVRRQLSAEVLEKQREADSKFALRAG